MNENESMETLEVNLEREWEGEGTPSEVPEETEEGSGPEEVSGPEEGSGPEEAEEPAGEGARPEEPAAPPPVDLRVPRGEPGKEHPLLTRARQRARRQDMERFLSAYPQVKAQDIPRQVWEQVAGGTPLVSAWAMHENQQLRAALAAQRQNQLNRQRTTGSLGGNMGAELDELDRMWDNDD